METDRKTVLTSHDSEKKWNCFRFDKSLAEARDNKSLSYIQGKFTELLAFHQKLTAYLAVLLMTALFCETL